LSAIFARKGPPEKVDKAVKLGFPCRFCRAKRKADSINSDMVRPCRAASCLTLAIKRSSILRVVFIRKTLHENMAIWSKSQSDVGAKRLGMKRFAELLRDQGGETAAAPAVPRQKARALISAALGVGDILRVTPLIRVAHRLGYETDVLLATDYADVVELLEGAPEIRQVFHVPSPRRGTAPDRIDGLTDQSYELATFTTWSAALRDRVQARRVHLFERDRWLTEGDSRCIERVAHELGWRGNLPPPFAMASSRRFDLSPGTIAIHPGCKYEWPRRGRICTRFIMPALN